MADSRTSLAEECARHGRLARSLESNNMMESVEVAQIDTRGLRELLEAYERQLIMDALEASDGHQRRAAAALGVLPSTLCEKMKRLGIRSRAVYDVESLVLETGIS